MALEKKNSISTFITKFLWTLFLVFQVSNLVICDDFEDSLKTALEAIERSRRDYELQGNVENEYYGQPENIGYGYQKILGFFDDNGPATELGSYDSVSKNDNELKNYVGNYPKDFDYQNSFDKRKSNFRERMSNSRSNYLIKNDETRDDYSRNRMEYLQLLKNLWLKYRQFLPYEINIEDLTDEQVEEILNSLDENGNNENTFGINYGSSETMGDDSSDNIPVRNRKNYRVFDRFSERKKRYPMLMPGKRNLHSQNINYENPLEPLVFHLPELKYDDNPKLNLEVIGNPKEGFERRFGDEKYKDVIRILNNAKYRPTYVDDDEPYWMMDQNNDEENIWLTEPVTFSDEAYEDLERNEKRKDFTPKIFKDHNGIHLNAKRFPVKRSSVRVRKEVKDDKISKELKGIFGATQTTAAPPKKGTGKKPTEIVKKQNVTKPEVTKHYESKKIVRRADKYSREQVLSANNNKEIADLFNVNKKSVNKKSIDWSQYFGIDKRSTQNWLKNDYLTKAEGHLMSPKIKRLSFERQNTGNVNFLDPAQYQMPFDTRKFNKKSYSYDIRSNIDKVESKIDDIEEKIIDDAVKYTGSHSGKMNEDLSHVKNKVIQHLEAAYSLEKMKNALEEFKNLVKPKKDLFDKQTLNKPSTKAPKSDVRPTTVREENPSTEKPGLEASKRVATKKEGVESIFSQDPSEGIEFLNNPAYSNRQHDKEECPALDKILYNCLRTEEIGGRYSELLVRLCSLQQICIFCGLSEKYSCDAIYWTEAQNICQGESECLVRAGDSMFALQQLYEQDLVNENSSHLMSGSCEENPCVLRYFSSRNLRSYLNK